MFTPLFFLLFILFLYLFISQPFALPCLVFKKTKNFVLSKVSVAHTTTILIMWCFFIFPQFRSPEQKCSATQQCTHY